MLGFFKQTERMIKNDCIKKRTKGGDKMKKPYLIFCGKLFDGIHEELMSDMEILVEGNQITAVGRNLSRPKDVETIAGPPSMWAPTCILAAGNSPLSITFFTSTIP